MTVRRKGECECGDAQEICDSCMDLEMQAEIWAENAWLRAAENDWAMNDQSMEEEANDEGLQWLRDRALADGAEAW